MLASIYHGMGIDLDTHDDARPRRPADPAGRSRADPPVVQVTQTSDGRRDAESTREATARSSEFDELGLASCCDSSVPLVLSVLRCLAAPLCAAEPTVRNVNVRGLQIGGTTTLTIDGDDLGKAPKLLLPFAAKQTLKPGNTDKKADVRRRRSKRRRRPATPPPRRHRRRRQPARRDRRGRAAAAAVRGEGRALPVALHGTVTGSHGVETTFTGKAGQKVMVEVEAQRLGSKLRPVVHLYNAKKLQLAWAWGTPGAERRHATRSDAARGRHVHGHAARRGVRGAGPGFFRLKIGAVRLRRSGVPAGRDARTRKSVELLGSTSAKIDSAADARLGDRRSPGRRPARGAARGRSSSQFATGIRRADRDRQAAGAARGSRRRQRQAQLRRAKKTATASRSRRTRRCGSRCSRSGSARRSMRRWWSATRRAACSRRPKIRPARSTRCSNTPCRTRSRRSWSASSMRRAAAGRGIYRLTIDPVKGEGPRRLPAHDAAAAADAARGRAGRRAGVRRAPRVSRADRHCPRPDCPRA